eukprot:m.365708 g.365708  ORF g.365708 m.365708 type:complete len:60 (+) comp20819_c0_seq10:1371-1550(+)
MGRWKHFDICYILVVLPQRLSRLQEAAARKWSTRVQGGGHAATTPQSTHVPFVTPQSTQ